jgi:hypothetical protein
MPCPIEFETNCKNRDDKCDVCLAITGEGKLYYKPILKLKEPHPCKDLAASARGKESNKRGRKVEANVVKELGLAPTEASGAKFRDGDGNLLLPNGDIIATSIKSRTGANKLGVTAKEWRVDEIHITHSKEYGKVFHMSELVFEQLVNGYVRQKEQEIIQDKEL